MHEPNANGYRLVDLEESRTRGLLNLGKWLSLVEKEWRNRRSEKAERMTALEWLNYVNKLTRQNPRAKYKVIYNTSGTYLVSAVVKKRKRSVTANGIKIPLKGIIIDCTLYSYETNDEDEAYYLSAVLNSTVIDEAIKPAQARGLFGPRHIHKKPFEIAILKFNPQNSIHLELSKLGKTCTKLVKKMLPDLEEKFDSIGWIRKKTKEALKPHINQIDDLVLKLFEAYGDKGTLDAFTKQS